MLEGLEKISRLMNFEPYSGKPYTDNDFSKLEANKLELIDMTHERIYSACVIDANYMAPNKPEIEIACKVYNILKTSGTIFMAIAGRDEVVNAARTLQIPAVNKSNFSFVALLRQIK